MAYGRVNILGSGGVGHLDNLKTIDTGQNTRPLVVDYVRKRKINYGEQGQRLLQNFNNNIILKLDNYDKEMLHVGFVEIRNVDTYEYELYNIITGKKVNFPKGFRPDYDYNRNFILNEEMDYIAGEYIRYSDGSIKHKLKEQNNQIRLIHKDTVYFANHQNGGYYTTMYAFYKYENRSLEKLNDYIKLQATNFL